MQDDDEEETSFLKHPQKKHHGESFLRSRSRMRILLPWCLTLFFAALSLFEFLYFKGRPGVHGSYETGFETDFDEAKSYIKLEQRRFTHAIRIHENGTLYPVLDPLEPVYTGRPSSEIDEAWDELTNRRYFRFTPDEVGELKKDTFDTMESFVEVDGDLELPGYYGGVDFLHSLHCLNGLRKHLDLKYYEPLMDLPKEYRQMHIYHCIDQLRQAILCHGDTTPVTLLPIWGGEQALLGQTERMHTCRDSKELRQWVLERGRRMGYLGR